MSQRYRVMVFLAATVIVVAGLRYAQPFLVPVLFGAALAAISWPISSWVTRRGLPSGVGALAALVVDVALLGFVGVMLTLAAGELQEKLPAYLSQLSGATDMVAGALARRGIFVDKGMLSSALHTDTLVLALGGAALTLANAASSTAVVLLVVFFALCELAGASDKIRALVKDPTHGFTRVDRVVREVQKYLLVKTLTSVLVAILSFVLLMLLKVELALLLAILLFILHFIPNIGSTVATIPAVLVALACRGPGVAIVVALGYFLINMLVGNLLEPRVLGRTLGLSPLVVLVGMLFWGWLWGPSGALLSVPLMMVAKIALENDDDLVWIARLVEPSSISGKLNPLRGRNIRKPLLSCPTVSINLDDGLPGSPSSR